jgi:hypothetical protein
MNADIHSIARQRARRVAARRKDLARKVWYALLPLVIVLAGMIAAYVASGGAPQ